MLDKLNQADVPTTPREGTTYNQRFGSPTPSSEEESDRCVHMAMKMKPKKEPVEKRGRDGEAADMEQDLPDDLPQGHEVAFVNNRLLRGKSYGQVTAQTPSHYISLMNVKPEKLDVENKAYVQWVKTHYLVDHNTSDGVPLLKRKTTVPPVPRAVHLPRGDRDQPLHIRKNNAQAEVLAASVNCNHTNCHHQGSSAKYRQFTCRDCGYKWQEERDADKVKNTPEECLHKNVDN